VMRKLSLVFVGSLGLITACSSETRKPCYSPNANVSLALDQGAVGCTCNPPVDQSVCVNGGDSVGYIAFICNNGRWQSAYDGPCLIRTSDAAAGTDGAQFPPDGGIEHPPADQRPAMPADASLDVPASGDVASGVSLDVLALTDLVPAETASATSAPSDARRDVAGDDGCIHLADIPMLLLAAEDSRLTISSVRVLSGPCTVQYQQEVDFLYWREGYSCPTLGDTVTCQIEATSNAGTVAVFAVTFEAIPLDSAMLHWEPQPYYGFTVKVPFPDIDGGTDADAGADEAAAAHDEGAPVGPDAEGVGRHLL